MIKTCSHVFKIKLDVKSIKIENSLPVTEKPRCNNSHPSLASPAPATRHLTLCLSSLSGKHFSAASSTLP